MHIIKNAKTASALMKKFPRTGTVYFVEGSHLVIPEPDGLAVELSLGWGAHFGRKCLLPKEDAHRYDIDLISHYFEVFDLGDYWALHGSVRWAGIQLSNGSVI